MLIINKYGKSEEFDAKRIHTAIRKSADRVFTELSDEDCIKVSDVVLNKIEEDTPVKVIHNLVECALDECGFSKVAESYRSYRNYKHDAKAIWEAVMNKQAELDAEPDRSNANCNSQLVSTKAVLAYGEFLKESYIRFFLTPEERKAVRIGYIYPHDMKDRYKSFNCFSAETKFISEKGIKAFSDFNDGEKLKVLGIDGNWHNATVRCYGKQTLNTVTFKRGQGKPITVKCTSNHRWILKEGQETTALKVGDSLCAAPDLYSPLLWEDFTEIQKQYWVYGFCMADGTAIHKGDKSRGSVIRVCKDKNQYKNRFIEAGFTYTTPKSFEGDGLVQLPQFDKKTFNIKEIPLEYIKYFMLGWMNADGNTQYKSIENPNSKYRGIQVSGEFNQFIQDFLNISGYYVTSTRDPTGQETNYGTRKSQTIHYQVHTNQGKYVYKVIDIQENTSEEDVWCVEVDDVHNFILEGGIPTGNCCLLNVGRIMRGGFTLENMAYTEPGSVAAAIAVASDIISVTSGNQYGGLTWPQVDEDLSYYCIKSYNFYIKEYSKIIEDAGCTVDPRKADDYAYKKVKREVQQGYQGIEHTFNSVSSCRGDFPFISFSFGHGKDRWSKLVAETILETRIGGQGKPGSKTPVLFPKLIFTYSEDIHGEGCICEDVFNLAAKCAKDTMYPDFLSLDAGYVGDMYKKTGKIITMMGKCKLQLI